LTGSFDTAEQVTAEQLLERIQHVVKNEAEVVEQQLRRHDVELFRGTASFIGPYELRIDAGEDSRQLTAGTVIIASGTRPAKPEGVPTGGVVMTSDDIR
jgi:NAD(P) transhydrogenase